MEIVRKILYCFSYYFFHVIMFIYCSLKESKRIGTGGFKEIRVPLFLWKLLFPCKKDPYITVPSLITTGLFFVAVFLNLISTIIVCAYDLDTSYAEIIGLLCVPIYGMAQAIFLQFAVAHQNWNRLVKAVLLVAFLLIDCVSIFMIIVVLTRSFDEICTLFLYPFQF